MKRVKRVFTGIHVGLWLLFSWAIALQTSQEQVPWLRITVAIVLTSLYAFYGHFMLLTRFSGRKKRSDYFLRLAGIVFTAPLVFVVFTPRKLDAGGLLSEYYFVTLISVVIPFVFLSWLARVTENLVINTVRKDQLEKQAVEAELYYLKQQINPHFLFNTLNNIHTLVYKQASTAPDAVMQLASLMRYMIYESNTVMVPLDRELAYLQDYVGLQQLRYKQNGVVDLRVEGATDACQVAPLLFIHLLENAYKHSPAKLSPGDISVRVLVQQDTLTFSVQNPVGKNAAETFEGPGGIGLQNVKKRLALLYPDAHALNIEDTGDRFTVSLKIQVSLAVTADRLKHEPM